MAVTLTNFAVGQQYAFAVKVKYVKNMTSNYSKPCTIDLVELHARAATALSTQPSPRVYRDITVKYPERYTDSGGAIFAT